MWRLYDKIFIKYFIINLNLLIINIKGGVAIRSCDLKSQLLIATRFWHFFRKRSQILIATRFWHYFLKSQILIATRFWHPSWITDPYCHTLLALFYLHFGSQNGTFFQISGPKMALFFKSRILIATPNWRFFSD